MSEKGLSGLWYDKKKEWELVELPVYQPDDDEIVVRVTATGICGSDLHVTRGDGRDENSPERGPLAMGHEMTGVIHSLGKKVKTDSLKKPLKEGDRVSFQPDSEYEFNIDEEKLYRMYDHQITMQLWI